MTSLLFLVCIPNQVTFAAANVDELEEQSMFSLIGPWSISAALPNGGSVWGTPALGARFEVSEGEFLSLGLQLSSSTPDNSSAQGLQFKWQHMFLTPLPRSFPYLFVQGGLQSVQLSAGETKDSSLLAAVGLGVEVSLIREISTSFESGFGGVFWPSRLLNYSAATTHLAIHYHFQN
jgi:hypothetical protein